MPFESDARHYYGYPGTVSNLNPAQFHPNVDHYRDGGMGGVGEDHSVVGFVPTEVLAQYRQWDRRDTGRHPGSAEKIAALREDLRSGKGFTTPLMLDYNPREHWAVLGEGNHRLVAAEDEHVPVVPVRVTRSYYPSPHHRLQPGELPGAPASHQDLWSQPDYPYTPSDLHPSYMHLEKPTTRTAHEHLTRDDLLDSLLQPSWSVPQ